MVIKDMPDLTTSVHNNILFLPLNSLQVQHSDTISILNQGSEDRSRATFILHPRSYHTQLLASWISFLP